MNFFTIFKLSILFSNALLKEIFSVILFINTILTYKIARPNESKATRIFNKKESSLGLKVLQTKYSVTSIIYNILNICTNS